MTDLHAPTAPNLPHIPQMILMSDEEVASYGLDPEAGFGALRTARGLLPLRALNVDAHVAGVIATIELTQQFVNVTSETIEATYIFPLPDRAAVHRFRMEVAGRVIDGLIDERGAARTQYDQALAAGHRAAIAEEERAGVFTLRVGNLPPGETATVRLSLVGPLPVDDGEVTFRFPLVVAPRYIPGIPLGGDQAGSGNAPDTDLVPDASRISPSVLLPGSPNPVKLSMRVTLEDGAPKQITSSLHAITDTREGPQVIEVRPGERLDRDFILRWRIDAAELVSSLVYAPDPDGAGGTFALTIVPPSTQTVGARPRDVVLVIDRSGSMEGWKMVAARRAAARMIDTLTSRDRFCALAFDTSVEALLPESGLVAATDHHRSQATSALAQLESRGGTEIARPLVQALAMLRGTEARERYVVLITDGQIGDERNVLRQVTRDLGDTRVFTLGIDQAVNATFLRSLAAAGGGLCELVESEARLDAVMAKIHRRIGAPLVTSLTLGGNDLELARQTVAPNKLPDVYAGAPVVILGRYQGPAQAGGAIEVSGESLGESWRQVVTLHPLHPLAKTSTWLAASWARAHLRDLDDRYAAGDQALETEIVRISKQFGVLSRFTAFVAIDHRAVVSSGGKLRRVVQAVESPAGWGPQVNGVLETLAGSSAGPTYSGGPTFTCSVGPASTVDPTYRLISSSGFGQASSRAVRPQFEAAVKGAQRSHAGMLGGTKSSATSLRKFSSAGGLRAASSPPATGPAITGTAYARRLEALATELRALATGSCNPVDLRQLRLRLTQWIEDVRSVGSARQRADAVEALVNRLSAALPDPGNLTTEVRAIAHALTQLTGGAPPAPPIQTRTTDRSSTPAPTRPSFWK